MQAKFERYAELVSEGQEKQSAEKEAGSESDDSAVEKKLPLP